MTGRQWLIAASSAVALGYAIYLLRGILLPFVAGVMVGYFLDPVVDRMQRAGIGRTVATTLVTLAFFAVVGLAVVLVVPALHTQVLGLAARAPAVIDALRETLMPLAESVMEQFGQDTVRQKAQDAVGGLAGTVLGWVKDVLGSLWSGGMALFNLVSLIVITPVVAFYLLRDYDMLVARVDEMLPRRQAPTVRLLAKQMDEVLAAFIRGQAMVCLAQAIFYGLALSVAGLNFGLAIGILAGAVAFIPYVGALTGFGLSIAVGLAQHGLAIEPLAVIIGIFAVGQTIENFLLMPYLVGDRVGLHPVWVIFALMAGGALWGFVGVLLAVPVAALIAVLVRFGFGRWRDSQLYRQQP
ncbi:MAG: AI-2E family transporter [Alphaproteobacteria bacterium]|nr:AI-2E family transporter [Alphaproteobacteria bacterium]